MNFNDKLNDMVEALKEQPEYKEYMSLKSKIKLDSKIYDLLKEFKEKEKLLHMDYINGNDVDKNKKSEMENLYSIIIQNEDARNLLQNEMKINYMLADVNKKIADAIKEIVEF